MIGGEPFGLGLVEQSLVHEDLRQLAIFGDLLRPDAAAALTLAVAADRADRHLEAAILGAELVDRGLELLLRGAGESLLGAEPPCPFFEPLALGVEPLGLGRERDLPRREIDFRFRDAPLALVELLLGLREILSRGFGRRPIFAQPQVLLIEFAPHEVQPLALLLDGPLAGGQRFLLRRVLHQSLVEQRAIAFEGLSQPGCRGFGGSQRRLVFLESRLLLLEFRQPRFELAVLLPQRGQAAAEIGFRLLDFPQPLVELVASGVVLSPPAGQIGLLCGQLFGAIRQLACRLGQCRLVRGHPMGLFGEVRLELREIGRPGGQLRRLSLEVAPA